MKAALESLGCVTGRQIVLISHDLSQTGSPLLLAEVGVKLRLARANVQLVTLAEDAHKNNLAARNGIKVLSTTDSFTQCAQADLVIANTAAAGPWVNQYLKEYSQGGHSLIWWIHEINAHSYARQMPLFSDVAMALFDSSASLRSWTDTGLRFPPITRVIYPCVDDTFVEKAAKLRFAFPRTGILQKFPIKAAAYTREKIRRKLGIDPDDFVMTLIGTYQFKKGHDLFVKTVSRMFGKDPKLRIKVILVGFGSEEQKNGFMKGLNKASRRALDSRRAVTVVEDLAPYYAAADAFVMNSQDLGENFGRVTIEAMTFRLPVLGTNAGGTPEIVEEGVTGLLHPLGIDGQDKLAENILTLVKNREGAKAMGEAGYRRIQEKFSSPRFYAELGRLLETVLGRRRK